MYPATSEASQATNELDMAAGPVRAQRESLGSCPRAHTRPELPARIRNYQVSLRDHIDPGSSL